MEGHSFTVMLPQAKPKGVFGGILYLLGYVSKKYMTERERFLSEAFNLHIRETIVMDRKAVVLKLKMDRQAIGEALLSRIAALEEENNGLKIASEKAFKD